MMSYRLLPKLTISSLCIASLACTPTTPLQNPIITATKITEWETRLPSKQGSVKITFTLPETARAEFQLFDGKSKYVSYAKTRVTFTNENCVSGHLTAVNYKKNDSEFHIKYFEKEATWNKNNTVTMTWNTNNQITTALNDEIISAEITGDVNTLKIVSYSAPIEIQKIEYIPH